MVRFELSVLLYYRYPWHVLFTGVRILLESGSVVDYFSSDDTTGEYIGYQ